MHRSSCSCRVLASSSAVLLALALGPACGAQDDTVDQGLKVEGLKQVGDIELFVRIQGGGEPIVFVHGGPGFDHSYFLPHVEALADEYQLVFYDQRVSGHSPPDLPAEAISLRHFLDDIENLRKLLGVERIHLLGHSFGGMLAMQYAVRHPERLHSLLLVNSTAAASGYSGTVNERLLSRLSDEARARRDELMQSEAMQQQRPEAIRELLDLVLAANFHDPRQIDQLDLYVAPDVGDRSRRLQALAPDVAEYDLYDELAELHVPTLIVRGSSEVLPREATERIRDAIPNSRLEEMERCGHFSFIECRDETLATLRDFLADLDPQPTSQP